ncbi:MAG: hypothetical protein IKC40_03850 [Oscillospiraceae bacterium]|nr:hypothetical protein [Oscillospiraceae bacterium]MBR6617223.1 hypothetical protein [Oscillospiraceae bacterium]
MMLSMYESMARRIRIRSASDVGLLIVLLAVVIAAQYFLPKYFTGISETKLKVIIYAITIPIAVVWFFLVDSQ